VLGPDSSITGRGGVRLFARQLLQLRIGLAVGMDPLPVLIGLRDHGATWEEIARAVGVTGQSAHERWAPRVAEVLDRVRREPETP
jgi:hypothetical protein